MSVFVKTLASEASRRDILRRLRTLQPDTPGRWGRMSSHQAVCHLGDSFRMALGRRPVVVPATGPLLRRLVKWVALYTPLPWRPGVMTVPELDQACAGTKPVDFATDLRELEALLDAFGAVAADAVQPEHPFFGRMSRRDWLRWAYAHTDHHLRQFGV